MPQEINRPSKQRKKKNGKESKSTDGLAHSLTHSHSHSHTHTNTHTTYSSLAAIRYIFHKYPPDPPSLPKNLPS